MNVPLNIFLVILLACFCFHQASSKQCGAEFVRAVYQACGVARRAFRPMEAQGMTEEQPAEGAANEEPVKRGGGGSWGKVGGGGLFRRQYVTDEEHKGQHIANEMPIKRGGGGSWGKVGGGGLFRRQYEEEDGESSPYSDSFEYRKDQQNSDNTPENEYYPSSKPKGYGHLEDLTSYLKKTGQSGGRYARSAPTGRRYERSAQIFDQRGNTAVNLLADFCCKNGCDWRTLVGLCK